MSKCATCNVQFENINDMREHFQCDWHSHNVKLRVDGKKPVSKAAFRDAANGEEGFGDDKPQFACTLCKKYFHSVQTLTSHVKSTEHLLKKEKRIIERDSQAASMLTSTSLGSAALGLHRRAKKNKKQNFVDPFKVENVPKVDVEKREEDVTEKSCVFDGHVSESVEANLKYMKEVHSFAIPMEEHCSDVEGLLGYMARKINGGMCLVCGADSKNYATLEAVRAHMKAANHEYIVLSPEYNDFYDCDLDDPDADVEKRAEEADGQLIVSDAGKRVAKRRNNGMQKFRTENLKQETERRMITQQKAESTALVAKERRLAEQPARVEEMKRQHKQQAKQHKWDMKMGVRGNMLHPKGYDGEGLKSGN